MSVPLFWNRCGSALARLHSLTESFHKEHLTALLLLTNRPSLQGHVLSIGALVIPLLRAPRALHHLPGHVNEQLLHVAVVLCARFQEHDVELLCELVPLVRGHLPVRVEVALVPDEDLHDLVVRVTLIDLLHPLRDLLERLPVRDVVDDDDPVAAVVVALCDGAEPLLASGIPDLELDDLAIVLGRAYLEVDANCRNEIFVENTFRVADQEARFADTGLADDENFWR